ncbi:hypothetical protein B0T17DRAFT_501410 [Bombardia bombarda]|uniref:Zn(2)-C6 fungal-type domain-containing protein n=1 Tax=Bombardia bombarda TaxID=252184 RepID=A0AA39T0M9_9PEZI|nr:hypothetical protein B0T17DRAFT_501410 [Bombardia bombarda]
MDPQFPTAVTNNNNLNPAGTGNWTPRPPKRKACLHCTKSKRKCDRTAPQCIRCLEKGVRCCYPPPRRPSQQHAPTNSTTSTPSTTPYHPPFTNFNPLSNPRWFLSPSTFTRQHRLVTDPPVHHSYSEPFGEETLPCFIANLQKWSRAWTTDGHSPLTHRSLYRGHMPDCVQDAYTALATYHAASTPQAKRTVLHIVNTKAVGLVASQGGLSILSGSGGVGGEELDLGMVMLDTSAHLARTTALYVYQLVRLFDGDIRARAQAEEMVDTLQTWAGQMLESARLDCVAAEGQGQGGGNNPFVVGDNNNDNRDPSTPSLWHAWIVAESIRRLYLTATYMQCVYLTIKRGWSMCPGGAPFSPGSDLWDAPSAYAWRVKTLECWRIMEEAKPNEVDEFTHAVLMISFGLEGGMEKWLVEAGKGFKGVEWWEDVYPTWASKVEGW